MLDFGEALRWAVWLMGMFPYRLVGRLRVLFHTVLVCL